MQVHEYQSVHETMCPLTYPQARERISTPLSCRPQFVSLRQQTGEARRRICHGLHRRMRLGVELGVRLRACGIDANL